ncbi:(RS)-norcoclaurine 6-O-methyltransferase-like [Oopsacas minuta]|uniref:Acetylserotonin O-methyltransferase n=1 Tax=Oopsacas minuta TaxID=111878 RepID=A0AAV7K514_9METZ|nr:(RS)-norcoclaurine 6-O-methyltransferase-like [Oopsacas minuta]
MAQESSSNPTDIEASVSSLNFLFNGHLLTYCIGIACKLNVAGIIAEADKSLSLQELAEKIPGEINFSYFKRIIRFLCAFGVFQESLIEEEGRYSLTRLSELMRNDIKGRISLKNGFEMMVNPTSINAWSRLENCVRSKKLKIPYDEAMSDSSCHHAKEGSIVSTESSPHEHSQQHEDEYSHEHDESIYETHILMKYYAHGFKELEDKKAHILDLGGHSGSTLGVIKESFQNLACSSLDLASTVETLKQKPEGVEIVSGNYFKPETIPNADAILLKHIAHMYPDQEKCVELLKNCKQALSESGRIILCECVIPKIGSIDVDSENCKRAFMADISMLLFGVEARTMDEFLAVFYSAGLKVTEFIETPEAMTQIFILEKI